MDLNDINKAKDTIDYILNNKVMDFLTENAVIK